MILQKFKVKKQKDNEYLQCKLSSKERANTAEIHILLNSENNGLLNLVCEEGHSVKTLKFNISNKGTLKAYLSNPQTQETFVNVLQNIANIMRFCENNSLSTKKIIFDTSLVFVDAVSRQLLFIYYPVENFENDTTIEQFLSAVASQTVSSKTQNSDYLIEFRKYIENLRFFSLVDFEKRIEQLSIKEKQNEPNYRKKGYYSGRMVYDPFSDASQEVEIQNTDSKCRCPNCKIDYPEGTKFCGECGENLTPVKGTTSTSANPPIQQDISDKKKRQTKLIKRKADEPIGSLLRVRTNEEIIIEKEMMVIGYDDDCDIVINDNETVSGHHAEFTVKDDSVYIADLNSTNGTYLNEKELIYLKKYKLFDGDKIELADEVLFFRGRVINE